MKKQNYQENLPFFINGTLSDEDNADFEQALLSDASLQKEADFLSALRQKIKNEPVQSPAEMGLHRLKRDIKNQAISAQIDTNATHQPNHNSASNKWRLFAVAASLMLVLQTGLMITMAPTDDMYVPLSGTVYIENVVQVEFKDSAKARDISALLTRFNASIIEGPSQKGIYRVYIKNLSKDVIQQLQQSDHVIDFIAEE